MRFLLSFLMARSALPDAELSNKCFGDMMSFVDELECSGNLLFDSQVLPDPPALRLVETGDSVSVDEAADEYLLGGFFVITAPGHLDALAIAKRCPHAQVGPIELRALNEAEENAYP